MSTVGRLLESHDVDGNVVIVKGIVDSKTIIDRRPIIRRKPATLGQSVGILGRGLTEYLWFNFQGLTYLGYFGLFGEKWQMKMPRPAKIQLDEEGEKRIVIPRKYSSKAKTVLRPKHQTQERIGYRADYIQEKYDKDHAAYILKRVFSKEEIANANELPAEEQNLLVEKYSEKNLPKQLTRLRINHGTEIDKRKAIEMSKYVELDIPGDTAIDRSTLIGGVRIEL